MKAEKPSLSAVSSGHNGEMCRRRANLPVAIGLLLILALGAGLRLWGIGWGLPSETHIFSYHPDEYHSLRGALALLWAGDPNPHFFNYGSLYLYLAALAVMIQGRVVPEAMTSAALAQLLHDWTLAARVLNVLLALATIGAAYAAGREWLGWRAGLGAALAVTVFPLHVLHSHYATVDVPQACFIAWTLFFALRIVKQAKPSDYLWAGLCSGLAASVKYNGGLVLLAPLLAHCLADPRERRTGRWAWPPFVMCLVALGAFAATSPYTFLDWTHAREDILFELQHMRQGEEPARSADPNGAIFHAVGLLMTTGGGPVAALISLGLGLGGRSRVRREAGLLAVWGLLWFVMIAIAGVRYGRYEIGLLPVLALLMGGGISLAKAHRAGVRLLALGSGSLVFGLCICLSVQLGYRLQKERDPRDRGLEAVLRYVPPGRSVGLAWEPWFNAPPIDPLNGGAMLRRNPFWRQFRQPKRPLMIVGTDAAQLRGRRPFAFVLSNFEIRDALRVGDPQAQAFRQTLSQLYTPAGIYLRRAPAAGLWGWQPPQDWLYPFPEISVFIAREER